MTNTHQDPRQSLIDAFQKEHPQINVRLLSAPADTDAKRDMLREVIPDKEDELMPDVYLGDVVWPAEFAHSGLALSLDEHFSDRFWDRFPVALRKAARYRDKPYAVPFYADQSVLLYRKDLLDEVRLSAPRTWQELDHAARLLLEKERVKRGFLWQGAPYEGLTCVWTEFAADFGMETPEEPRDLRIDSPEAINALSFMRKLVTGVSTGVTDLRELNSMEIFKGGKAAFLRAWSSSLEMMRSGESSVRGKVEIAPLPILADAVGAPQKGASTIGGGSLFINPHTKHLAEAVKFVDWLTAVPAQLIVAQYSQIPTNKDVRVHPVVTDNRWLATSMDVQAVRRPSNTPKYSEVSKAIYGAVHRALQVHQARQGGDPKAMLQEAQSRLDKILTDT
jgi:multiple sugar transport system substrate-binding protein